MEPCTESDRSSCTVSSAELPPIRPFLLIVRLTWRSFVSFCLVSQSLSAQTDSPSAQVSFKVISNRSFSKGPWLQGQMKLPRFSSAVSAETLSTFVAGSPQSLSECLFSLSHQKTLPSPLCWGRTVSSRTESPRLIHLSVSQPFSTNCPEQFA